MQIMGTWYDENRGVTTPNMALLDTALGHIEANPQEWNQKHWRCGSAGCIAFHLAALSGAEWLMDTRFDFDLKVPAGGYAASCFCCESTGYGFEDVVTPDGRVLAVSQYAREVAGLSEADAFALFLGNNTLHQLGRMIERLREKASERSSPLADEPLSPACGTASTGHARELDRSGSALAG